MRSRWSEHRTRGLAPYYLRIGPTSTLPSWARKLRTSASRASQLICGGGGRGCSSAGKGGDDVGAMGAPPGGVGSAPGRPGLAAAASSVPTMGVCVGRARVRGEGVRGGGSAAGGVAEVGTAKKNKRRARPADQNCERRSGRPFLAHPLSILSFARTHSRSRFHRQLAPACRHTLAPAPQPRPLYSIERHLTTAHAHRPPAFSIVPTAPFFFPTRHVRRLPAPAHPDPGRAGGQPGGV